MSMKTRINIAAEKLQKTGVHPRHVHLTKTNALQLQTEMIAEGGELAHSILRNGMRKAMATILGLQIVWESLRFEVD